MVGNTILTNYLYLHHVPRSGELAVLLAALIGAGLGFLWFNAPPAMVFMGDTGSLAIGGALGAVAVVTKHEIVLAIVGGLFVLETVSVIVQVCPTSGPGAASSAWRRCTTTSSRRAGPSRPSSSVSGSSPPSWRWPASPP